MMFKGRDGMIFKGTNELIMSEEVGGDYAGEVRRLLAESDDYLQKDDAFREITVKKGNDFWISVGRMTFPRKYG